ncbi:MAG: lytic transglycosylase domain-containing protein [Acidimicrobiaceae bacterium]|nr:lytic transglycosylase domain-containing protein [Acidimicrobiaceae bacterium]
MLTCTALASLGVALLPLAGAVLAMGGLAVGAPAGSETAPTASGGIPGDYLADFERAGSRFGVSWAIIAGIYAEECDFGRSGLAGCNPPGTENPAGAQGPGQFLPTTWRRGLAPYQLIPPGPPTRRDAEGYATDGDGDGIADPWDPADATASTARLLASNGAASGEVRRAIFSYNHDPGYVDAVLAHAAAYEHAVTRS